MHIEFKKSPPMAHTVTDYDKACLELYVALLDTEAASMDWIEAYEQLFGSSSKTDQKFKLEQYRAHLERARWMANYGYRQLL